MHTTSPTLLERLRTPVDAQAAWGRFVELYTPLLFRWARGCGLQGEDAADLVQDVFAALLKKVPGFVYDSGKSFRAWLKAVTLNVLRDRQRAVATRPLPGGNEQIQGHAVPDHVVALEDEEYRQYLVSRCLELMKADFEATTWKAAWEHGVLGRQASAVAAEFGISLSAVYCARSRVLSRLREELQGLLD